MPRKESFREIARYLRQQKAYWMIPLVVILILFSLLLIFASSSTVAPFIYTLF